MGGHYESGLGRWDSGSERDVGYWERKNEESRRFYSHRLKVLLSVVESFEEKTGKKRGKQLKELITWQKNELKPYQR